MTQQKSNTILNNHLHSLPAIVIALVNCGKVAPKIVLLPIKKGSAALLKLKHVTVIC